MTGVRREYFSRSLRPKFSAIFKSGRDDASENKIGNTTPAAGRCEERRNGASVRPFGLVASCFFARSNKGCPLDSGISALTRAVMSQEPTTNSRSHEYEHER
jgi:hypothetical protein